MDDAIEMLSPAKLLKIAKKYLDLKRLRPDEEQATRPSLLTAVKRFEKVSMAGEYYDSFNANSKNYTQKSAGTCAWIGEYRRFLDRCVLEAKGSDQAEVREAMDILFGLLDHIDECRDDVIFFADEGGSWQVGVDWPKVLPVCWPNRITALLSSHYSYGRDKMLAVAHRTATPGQRKALVAVRSGVSEKGP